MRRTEGFTLVEMMIALAVSAMLLGGVYSALISTQRTAGLLSEDEMKDSTRARAIELLRGDFRARQSLKVQAGQEQACTLTLSSTADGLALGEMKRSLGEIRFDASPKGLRRSEGTSSALDLATGPVTVEFWEKGAWRKEAGQAPLAVRLLFSDPVEQVVLR